VSLLAAAAAAEGVGTHSQPAELYVQEGGTHHDATKLIAAACHRDRECAVQPVPAALEETWGHGHQRNT